MLSKFLINKGITHIFGYVGGANLPLINQFVNTNLKFIVNRNEQCIGHAASAFAHFSKKPGIILTTSGPGVTNLITPLQDAYSDGIPLIAITGQVPSFAIGSDAFQECPAINLTRPCTKWNYQMKKEDSINYVMNKAWIKALKGRPGPVHIDIPKDYVMNEKKICIFRNTPKYNTNVDNIYNLIQTAKRPVIFAGKGASEDLNELAEKLQIPVTTTLHGLGSFDENSPLALKMVGMHGTAYANFAVQNSDLIIGIGCRYDDRTTGNIANYAPNAKLIHVDFDKGQIDKIKKKFPNRELISHYSDGETFIKNLLKLKLKPLRIKPWLRKIENWKKKYPLDYESSSKIKTQMVINYLDRYLYENDSHHNTIFTTGVGNHQMMTAQFITWRNKSLMTSGSLGVMGSGLPYAIGAQLANPEKNVILIDGDGSFNMSYNDLMTIKELNLPIKIFIMNDSRLQMVHVWQDLFFDKRYLGTSQKNPNYSDIAFAHGIKSLTCSNKKDVKNYINIAMKYQGPFLIDFRTEPDYCLPLIPPGNNLDNMIISKSDMSKLDKNALPPS